MARDIAKAIKIREYFKDKHIMGFTASRNVAGVPLVKFVDILKELQADVWVTGGCKGGDFIIGQTLARMHPEQTHVVVLPHNRSQVFEWWMWAAFPTPNVILLQMPEDSTYKDRNQMIVDISSELTGFPEYHEEHPEMRRSGTWQTIRMARKALIPTNVFVLRED